MLFYIDDKTYTYDAIEVPPFEPYNFSPGIRGWNFSKAQEAWMRKWIGVLSMDEASEVMQASKKTVQKLRTKYMRGEADHRAYNYAGFVRQHSGDPVAMHETVEYRVHNPKTWKAEWEEAHNKEALMKKQMEYNRRYRATHPIVSKRKERKLKEQTMTLDEKINTVQYRNLEERRVELGGNGKIRQRVKKQNNNEGLCIENCWLHRQKNQFDSGGPMCNGKVGSKCSGVF